MHSIIAHSMDKSVGKLQNSGSLIYMKYAINMIFCAALWSQSQSLKGKICVFVEGSHKEINSDY